MAVKSMVRGCLVFCVCVVVVVCVYATTGDGVSTNDANMARLGEVAKSLAAELPQEHLSHRELDDEISRRAWRNYLRSLDPQRMYFLSKDVSTFREQVNLLDDALLKGDLSFATETYDLLLERMRDRVAFVEKQLEKGFDFTIEETFEWDRKDAPWAETQEEWDEVWRKSLKHQYLQQLVNKKIGEEEKAAKAEASDSEDGTETETPDGEDENEEGSKPPRKPPTPEESILKRYKQISDVLEHADRGSVVQRFLTSVTMAYDPHCSYMSPATKENFDISMKLSLVGIGALLTQEDGALKIEKVIPGGPADQDTRDKHLVPDDKIIAVGQGDEELVDILHWPMQKAVQIIRGEKGTKVVLEVIPASDPTGSSTKLVDLIRDEIKLDEREAKHEIREFVDDSSKTNRFGVITLPAFYADLAGAQDNPEGYKSCSRDVANILKSIRTNNVDGVLIDLRSNGGGSLREVALMTGHFIPRGPVVQVRQRMNISVLPDPDPSVLYGGPLIVLVNRLSASASEILAGALQDYGRALIVGDSQTFGKGTVQGVQALGDDREKGSIKITNALFYRITGSSTQLKGVSSDVLIPSATEFMDIGESFRDYAMEWTRVRPLQYRPVAGMSQAVRALIDQAEDRRADSARFAAYTNLLAQVEELNDAEELPLQLERRLDQARERKKLADRQKELEKSEGANGADRDEDGEVKSDIILDEALEILSDYVSLHPPKVGAAARGM